MLKKTGGSLLLVIPSVVLDNGSEVKIEADFVNNLRVYSRNFEGVTFACPALTPEQNQGYILRSLPMSDLPSNVTYVRLPYTYREDTHLKHYVRTRRLVQELIASADYLLFSPHAPFDWSTVAAREAIKAKRRFDVECDLDWNSLMSFRVAATRNPIKRFRVKLYANWLRYSVDRCLRHSAVALLQGKEVFEAYRHAAPNPRMVLNVQVDGDDHISDDQVKKKVERILSGEPLRIVYAGQMTDRKGAIDWLKAIKSSRVVPQATWYGDGPERPAMERMGGAMLPGVRPRDEIMAAMREADVFLFCHKVAESPRCLTEALASGTALVGYRSLFPEGLVEKAGGGEFVPLGDWKSLGNLIAELDKDRERLASLVLAAAETGRSLDRDVAMQHRVELITQFCAA